MANHDPLNNLLLTMDTLFIVDDSFPLSRLSTKTGDNLGFVLYSDNSGFIEDIKDFCEKNYIQCRFFFPSNEINRIASEKKQEYIHFIDSLGHKPLNKKGRTLSESLFSKSIGESLWWFSAIHEKNTTGFPSFHLFCFLEYLSHLIDELKFSEIHIHVSLRNNGRLILNHVKSRLDSQIRLGWSIKHNLKNIKMYFGLLYGVFILIRRKRLIQKRLGKRSPSFAAKHLYFLYYPFIDKDKAESKYIKSNYLKDYQEELETQRTIFIGTFVGDEISGYKEFLEFLANSRNLHHHYLVEELISWPVLIRLFLYMLIIQLKVLFLWRKVRAVKFYDINVASLLKKEFLRSFFDTKIFHTLLIYNSLGSFKDDSVESIYYIFENFGWERMLCLAARKKIPGSQVIAYQHCPFGVLSAFFSGFISPPPSQT
ncbi:hypothetical protein ACFLT9_03175 [Acidobacteriota bacterium]